MKTYRFKINGNEYNVEIRSVEGKMADVSVNGVPYQVEMENAPAVQAAPTARTAPVAAPAATAVAAPVVTPALSAVPAGAGKSVTSPLPGVIIEVSVKVGDVVKAGQKVAVVEAMKMENEISATQDGTVTAVLVDKGASVLEGADIVKIA